jgi:hypothetical protein
MVVKPSASMTSTVTGGRQTAIVYGQHRSSGATLTWTTLTRVAIPRSTNGWHRTAHNAHHAMKTTDRDGHGGPSRFRPIEADNVGLVGKNPPCDVKHGSG